MRLILSRPEIHEDVEEAIEITSLCKQLNCLPGPGGLLDQDAKLVMKMKCVIIAQNEREDREQAKLQPHK